MTSARHLMTASVTTVHPELSLGELDVTLVREGISGAPVVEEGRLLGVVSGSDVVRALCEAQESAEQMVAWYYQEPPFRGVAARGFVPREPEVCARRLAELRVRQVMSRRLIGVAPDAPADEVARLLVRHAIHRVLVIEGEKLLGIISSLDLTQMVAEPEHAGTPGPAAGAQEQLFFTPDLAGERLGDAEVATLRADPDTGATTLLVRLQAGGRIKAHTSQGAVQHFVLSGEYEAHGHVFRTGTYRLLPGPEIAEISSRTGAVLLVVRDPGGASRPSA